MFFMKLLFTLILLVGFYLPESSCVTNLKNVQFFGRFYGFKKEETKSDTLGIKTTGDTTIDGRFLFPINIFATWENREQKKDARVTNRSGSLDGANGRQTSSPGRRSLEKTAFLSRNIFAVRGSLPKPANSEQKKDARVTNRPKILEGAFGRAKSSPGRKSPWRPPFFPRIGTSKPQSRDPIPLVECMLNVVKLALPLVTLTQASDPVQNFLGIVKELSGEVSTTQTVAIAISPDTLASFVDMATPCLESTKQDGPGKLTPEEDFATNAAAEKTKKRPLGALALGATEALIENTSVTIDDNGKLQYDIDYTALAFALGMAAVQTTKIGQIAMKSAEGRSWLARGVTRNTEAGGQRSQSPINQVALLECTLNAAISSVSNTATKDPSPSSVNDPTCSAQGVLDLFEKVVTPCLELFGRDGDGKLGMGEDIIAEALKLEPMGMLAMKSADAIVASVSTTSDADGSIQYTFNYTDLASGLASAVAESTKIGQTPTIPADTRSRFNKGVGRFLWGPDSSLSCEAAPVGLATALKCVQACAVKTFEISWLTRGISQIIKGIRPRRQIPTNVVQILGCTSKAVVTSLYGGIFRLKPKIPVSESAEESGNPITPNILKLFVVKCTPCFGFFKRNEFGMLEIDPAFIRGTAAEALRLLPVGALVVGTIEVIVRNVQEIQDEKGELQYKINYPGLTTGLGVVIADATSFGVVGFATDVVTSFL